MRARVSLAHSRRPQLLDVLPDLVKDQNKLVRFAAVTVLLKCAFHSPHVLGVCVCVFAHH